MPYATVQDAEDLYGADYVGSSFDRDRDGSVDPLAATSAFSKASSEIDSYLATRFDVPVSPAPDVVKERCIDIAIYRVCPDSALTDEKRRRYEDAIAWLKDVAKGLATLDLGDDVPATATQDVPETSYPNARLFTRRRMAGL